MSKQLKRTSSRTSTLDTPGAAMEDTANGAGSRRWSALLAVSVVTIVALMIVGLVAVTSDRGAGTTTKGAVGEELGADPNVNEQTATSGSETDQEADAVYSIPTSAVIPTLSPGEPIEIRDELGSDITIESVAAIDLVGSSLARFSPTGTGQLVVIDAESGSVQMVDPDGASKDYQVAVDQEAGALHDAAVGPDGVLYMSQVGDYDQEFGEGVPYTTTAYRLVENAVIEPTAAWTSLWACGDCDLDVISHNGILQADGTVIPFVDPASTAPVLPSPNVQAVAPTSDGAACTDSAATSRMVIESDETTWDIEIPCPATTTTSGKVDTQFRPQSDGSVVAIVPLSDGATSLLWLRPDGSVAAANIDEISILDAAVIDGQLHAVTVANGAIELVELKF